MSSFLYYRSRLSERDIRTEEVRQDTAVCQMQIIDRKCSHTICCILQVRRISIPSIYHKLTPARECFFPLITHKFRRSLEPSVNERPQGPRRTALKPAGNLLVGFSGGLGSTVLLDLVHRCYVSMDQSTMPSDGGKQHPRHEKIWKRVSVCYVEIAGAFPGVSHSGLVCCSRV